LRLLGLAASALVASDLAAQQVQVDSLADAVTEGRLALELRPRYTQITDTDKPERTRAWTMRSIIGWQSATLDGWRAVVEGIHTDVVGASRLNTDPASNEDSPYPLLPEPTACTSDTSACPARACGWASSSASWTTSAFSATSIFGKFRCCSPD
jgi:hypothetical protein